MGTRFSVVLPGADHGAGEVLVETAERELRARERLMSRFDARSPLSEINRRAAFEPVPPPPILWEILSLCREHWARSRGFFDVAQLPLSELWRNCALRNQLPSPEALAAARRQSGFGHVCLDAANRTVRFDTPGVQLDLGGIGKGLALDGLTEIFKQQGVKRAFLSFGESSVTVIGSHPAGVPWAVGVADLFRNGTPVHTFRLQDASLSTSGNSPANGADARGRFGHIINSREGRPATGYRAVSVSSASAVEAEVLSTALLAAPVEERAPLLAGYPGVTAVEVVYAPRDGTTETHVCWRHEC